MCHSIWDIRTYSWAAITPISSPILRQQIEGTTRSHVMTMRSWCDTNEGGVLLIPSLDASNSGKCSFMRHYYLSQSSLFTLILFWFSFRVRCDFFLPGDISRSIFFCGGGNRDNTKETPINSNNTWWSFGILLHLLKWLPWYGYFLCNCGSIL